MLSVVVLNVTYMPSVLSVVMLNVVMLSAVAPTPGLFRKTYYGCDQFRSLVS
jgi:hypothetical protein